MVGPGESGKSSLPRNGIAEERAIRVSINKLSRLCRMGFESDAASISMHLAEF
jgi:hypothetical protein